MKLYCIMLVVLLGGCGGNACKMSAYYARCAGTPNCVLTAGQVDRWHTHKKVCGRRNL